MGCSKQGFPVSISQSLLKLMSFESVMPSNHLILCHSLLLLPSIFFGIRVFLNELALLMRWPKYWSFSISPANEYSGLISFRIDWLDLLAVQGTLKSFLQHHCSISPWGLIFQQMNLGRGITAWTKTFPHSFCRWSLSWPGFPWPSRHPLPALSPPSWQGIGGRKAIEPWLFVQFQPPQWSSPHLTFPVLLHDS